MKTGYKINTLTILRQKLNQTHKEIGQIALKLEEHTTEEHNGTTLYHYTLNSNNGRIETEERLDALNKSYDLQVETINWVKSIND